MNSNKRDKNWEFQYQAIRDVLRTFGTENSRRTADCWVDDDDIGTKEHKVYVRNLALLRPHVIKALQSLLGKYPDWEIMVAVSVPGMGEPWPDMGLTIRRAEIIDGLQRRYFPKQFQDIVYEGGRPGTDRD